MLQLWVQALGWNIQDQNSRKTATSISSRTSKIRFVQIYDSYIFPWQQPPTGILTPLFASVFLLHYSQYLSFYLVFPVPLHQYDQFPFPIYSNHYSTTSLLPDPSLVSWATGNVADLEMADQPGSIHLLLHSRRTSRSIRCICIRVFPPVGQQIVCCCWFSLKCFKNLNLFEIFILLSNSFGTGHHWGMTDRWYNRISLLSLGSHIKKKRKRQK